VTTRKNGQLQVTLDSAPRDIKGEGIGGVWNLIID
jgi:hypothetical protein